MIQNIYGNVEMTEWQKTFENSEIGCGPIVNLHTFTLDNWDVKHEKTTVARHNGHLGPIVETHPCRPKRLLPCRAFVTDLCGVNVPWRYNEKSEKCLFWMSKLVQILHELEKAISCFVTFCCVWVVLWDVWLVLITWWNNLVINTFHLYMVKSNLICAVRASCSLMVLSLFFGDSATTLLFEIFMFKVHEWRLGRDCKETVNPKTRLNKKMRLLYNGNGNQTCIIPRLPEALPILFKRSGFKGILHP